MKKTLLRSAVSRLKWFLMPAYGRDEFLRAEKEAEAVSHVLTGKTAVHISKGHLDIPEGTEEISSRALEGNKKLVSVSVPSTVKVIGDRAFAECENLEQVILREGLESIGDNVFTDCPKLRSIVIPDSVTQLRGQAFYRCGLTEPVLNVSGATLYFCPGAAAGTEYTVPEGVRAIGGWAFQDLPRLRQVRLPQTLERIEKMAFVQCGLTSVVIPAGVKEIGESVFCSCNELKTITLEEELDTIRTAVTLCRLRGRSFLARTRCELPVDDPYWLDETFQAIARQCGAGCVEAMEEMTAFFDAKHQAYPETAFYGPAANFWRYRAYEQGSGKAKLWLEDWLKMFPDGRMPSVFLTEGLFGVADGLELNALGFLFFAPDREYHLAGRDADGVVEVSAYAGEDGPDEDGFGMEIYYDWWYLDDNLCPVPGADCLHHFSGIDKRVNRERFQKSHDIAAQAIVQRGAANR